MNTGRSHEGIVVLLSTVKAIILHDESNFVRCAICASSLERDQVESTSFWYQNKICVEESTFGQDATDDGIISKTEGNQTRSILGFFTTMVRHSSITFGLLFLLVQTAAAAEEVCLCSSQTEQQG